MSLLTIIQDACDDLGITRPTVIVGSTDSQVRQLLQLAHVEARDLASRYSWSGLQREQTFTLALAQDQGAINSDIVTDGDFDSIINDTIWNRTLSEPIFGPINAMERQTLKAFPVTGPYQRYWIQGGRLYIDPVPTSADTAAFEYKTKAICTSSGGTLQTAWLADSDVGILDENLTKLGIVWRWLKRKGLDYAEDFATYESRVLNAMARDGGKPRLSMNARPMDRIPGIFVPQGNWTP